MRSLVVALVGTDHHPFHRLVTWVDAAAALHPDVRFLMQHGAASKRPALAEAHEFLTHDRLAALLSEADVVICHGGPGIIMDAREAGHVPLCVPRDPQLGEHVDGHQQRFAAMAGGAGVVRTVRTLEEFHDHLDHELSADHLRGRASTTMATQARDIARARLAAELDELITVRPRWFPRRQGRTDESASAPRRSYHIWGKSPVGDSKAPIPR